MGKSKTTSLEALGLSTNEAECYLVLLKEGALTVSQIAKYLEVLPNAVYRLLVKLENYGMVVTLSTSPKKYQAHTASAAIEALAQYKSSVIQDAQLAALGELSGIKSSSQTKIDYVVGREAFFKTFVELAAEAQSELLVISIGEPVPDEVKLVVRDALERGVKCKFIFHKYDKDNEALLQSWKTMGVQVAHFPDSGFHLFVIDGKEAVLVGSNPDDAAERVGMVISGVSLASALRDFFYTRLEKATQI